MKLLVGWIVTGDIANGADVIRDKVHVHAGFGANFGVSCLPL